MKKTATADEIRKAFRKAARKYHPDVNPNNKKAEEKFKEISEANDVLSEPKKRKVYDQFGFYSDNIDPAAGRRRLRAAGYGGGGFSWCAGWRCSRRCGREESQVVGRRFRSTLAGLIFPTLPVLRAQGGRTQTRQPGGGGGNFRDIFGSMFNGGAGAARQQGPQAGTDIEYLVSTDFWTLIRGGDDEAGGAAAGELVRSCKGKSTTGGEMVCPECHGSGQVTQMAGQMKFNLQCPRCGGSGRM